MTVLGMCFDGARQGVMGHYDPLLVVVSYLVAAFASYTALELAERLRRSQGLVRGLWQTAAALVLGGGVWSMHFVAILAFKIPLSHSFAPLQTLLSGLVAIGAVAAGLQIIRGTADWRRIAGAGVLVGLGIAIMHYTGMAALRLPGQIYYKPGLFVLSVVVAVGAATAALWLACVPRLTWQRAVGALVMAVAVCGMHYTGMAATEIVAGPAELQVLGSAVQADALAAIVAGGVTILLCVALVCAVIDRHLEQLRAQQRLRDAIDVMPAALGFYDAEDRLVAWNDAYAGFFENPAALHAGVHFVDLLRGPLDEAELSKLLAIRRQLGVVERQFPDGRWMKIESRRTADGGVVSIGTDITTLKAQAEALGRARDAAEAASQAKSVFLTTMGHELRTPLNGVLGMVQALAGDALTEAQGQRVEIIRQSSESLLAILGDLLDLTQIEGGALTSEDVEFDLDDLLRGLRGAHRLAAEAKGIAFCCEIAEAARGRYRGDSTRIRRIIHNLLDNAVKFTEHGEVRLTVDATDGGVAFEVADTGTGIAQEHFERLFEPFFQVDASLTRRHGGAGVGLAVSRQLAELLSGFIEVTSQPGEGSVFRVVLPLERLEAVATDACAEGGPGPAADMALRVLVAEDNPVNQMVLRTLLATAGVEPVLVDDGEAAVIAWAAQPWDIILMDIQMPKMNGIEAARTIRAREAQEGRARTPIIAVTANAMAHEARDYLAAGMDGVVAKPVDLAVLLMAIERALSPTGTSVQAA
jgi:signal transduction histidine kinase/ActR/RegA family two-component response regulator